MLLTINGFSNTKLNLAKQLKKTEFRIDSLNQNLEKLIVQIENVNKNNSNLETEIKILKNEISSIQKTNDFYSTLLSIQTGIFSLIVAIAIFLVGYLLPKSNERKYRKLIDEQNEVIEETKNEFKSSILFLDMIRLKSENSNKLALYTAIKSVENLLKNPNYTNSKRIKLVFNYINELKQNITNSELDSIILEEDVDFEKLIKNLNSNKYKDEYKKGFEKFRKLYK